MIETINRGKETLLPVKLLKELLRYEYETGLFYWIKQTDKHSPVELGRVAGYVSKSNGYVRIEINGYTYLAHRLAWAYVYGNYPEGEQPFIDHINGNPSDNRIENLKVSSSSQNSRNRKMSTVNTSGVTGVSRHAHKKRHGKII